MTPIYTALTRYLHQNQARFHVPGHKGDASPLQSLAQLLPLDVTELPQTGSLLEGMGCTAQAEQLATQFFQTAGTFFSAGGCTLCIQTMLRLAVPYGGTLILSRTAHKSTLHALALLNITPVWLMPRQDAGEGLAGRVWAEDVQAAISNHPEAAGVFLTSPDYYGVLCDIPAIARVCQAHRLPLLVDNAHGAHLWYTREKLHPIQQGAAMSACSAHKTLPVLTGGAFLHIAQPQYLPTVRQAMSLFASTSPSYPILLSLDLCRQWLEGEGEQAFARLRARVEGIQAMAAVRGLQSPQGLCDPFRLAWNTAARGLDGRAAARHLRRWGVEPEMEDSSFVVLVPSPFNSDEDFQTLEKAVKSLPLSDRQGVEQTSEKLPLSCPEQAMPLTRAVMSPSQRIRVEESAGRVAAGTACPCPPGVPLVMPGEKISAPLAEQLRQLGMTEIEVVNDFEVE